MGDVAALVGFALLSTIINDAEWARCVALLVAADLCLAVARGWHHHEALVLGALFFNALCCNLLIALGLASAERMCQQHMPF